MAAGFGLFLDRDGILIAETGSYVWHLEQSYLLNEARALIEVAARKQIYVVILTNQGGIGRNIYSYQQARYLNNSIENQLFAPLKIKPIWFICPHHPSTSLCWCRKPESLALERAMQRLKLKAQHSVFVGDQPRDMEAARRVGLQAFGLHPNNSVAGAHRNFHTHRECAEALAQHWNLPDSNQASKPAF